VRKLGGFRGGMPMPIRRRRNEEIGLDKILGAYEAKLVPTAAPAPAIATLRCWQCSRPTMYDTRRPAPRRCSWCRAILT